MTRFGGPGPIERRRLRHKLDGQNGPKINSKINYKFSDLTGEINQIMQGPFRSVQRAKIGSYDPSSPRKGKEGLPDLALLNWAKIRPSLTKRVTRVVALETSLEELAGPTNHHMGPLAKNNQTTP